MTANDPPAGTEPPFDPPADSDDGANRLQNFPVLTRVQDGSQVEVSLLSTPGQSFTIDLYGNDSCDPSGNGEGQQHLGTLQITTNAQGVFDCGVGACLFPVPPDKDITATATGASGSTSEFSFCGVEEIVVNSVEDDPLKQDVTTCTTGDEGFKTRTGEDECTLRAAIELANKRPGRDRIEFDIKEGSAPYTIQPSQALPEVSTPMSIDGTTQSGFVEGFFPIVELTGIDAGLGTSGLVVTGGSTDIKGLVINAFRGNGVVLRSQGGNRLDLNYIGTTQNGQDVLPNTGHGVFIDNTSENLIGLPEEGELPRNVISGNVSDGVRVEGRNASLNEIKGNYVGLDAFGSKSIGNKGSGINVIDGAFSNLILGNVVSGNQLTGIRLTGCAIDECEDINNPTHITRQNQVFVNLVGTNASGSQPLPNAAGVAIFDSADNTIGGPGRRNIVSGNGGPGIFVFGLNANRNIIQGNHVGVDPDGGCPEFADLGQSNPTCHHTGNGEGRRILGHVNLPAGRPDFRVRPPIPVAAGHVVTATATDDFGNTSEFSNCVVAQLDSDGDGVPDALEPPDLVNDGGKTSTPGGIIVELDGPTAVLELNPNSQPLTLPTGIDLGEPIDIRIDVSSVGSSSQVRPLGAGQEVGITLTLPAGFQATTYYNFGPEPNNREPHWYEFLFDGRTGATIKGQRVLIRLIDGQRGDHDLEANGVIETLGGPANLADLLFPFFQIEPGSFVGVAVSNFSDVDAELSFEARDADGGLLPAGENPATRFLSSGEQLARLSHELLKTSAETSLKGWLRVDTDNPRLGSFFQFGDLERLDGSVAITRAVSRLFFTRVFEGDTAFRGQSASTEILLANPGTSEITVQLRLLGSNPGNASQASLTGATSKTVSIPAGGVLSETAATLFGLESIHDGVIEAEVEGAGGMAGFELIRLRNRNTIIGLNAAHENPFVQLFSAQLASVPGIFTNLKLVNTAEQERTVTLEAIGEDGNPLSDPISRNLGPGEALIEDAGELFSSALEESPAGLVGSLKLRTDGPGILGDVVFGDPDDLQYAAALPLQSRPFTQAVFSQVANMEGFFTGMALYAPDEASKVSIEVHRANGELVGRSVQRLDAGQRMSKLVPELVPASAGQAGGYIEIRSTKPLIAQQLFGALSESGIQLLSAVPPTVVDEQVENNQEENPVPVLASIDPSSVIAGSPGFQLRVVGSNFIQGSQVRWNGQNRPTTFISANEVQSEIAALDIGEAGQAEVTVFNPQPGGGLSSPLVLVIDPEPIPIPNPVPVLSSLDPASGIAGSGAFTLSLTGSGFIEGSQVRWDGEDRSTSFISSGELQAEISAVDVQPVGQVQVTVFNPQPGGGPSSPLVFTIDPVPNPVPVLSSLDPVFAIAGSGAFTLHLSGSSFFEGSQVRWDGADRPTTLISPTQLQAEISAADISQVGQAEVTVFNPRPGGGSSSPLIFMIDPVPNPAPVLTSLDPASATVGSGDLTLNLMGTGFFEGSQVLWNGESRTTTFLSPTLLQAEIPAADLAIPGQVEVVVLNPTPGGGSSDMLLFEIADFTAPEVSEAEAEVLTTDSAQVRFRLEDPDGDVVQLLFTFFLNGTQTTVREVNSPEDVDLTGLTSGTITGTFTGLTVNPFELRPNEVRIVALDAQGLSSNTLSVKY